MLLPSQLVDPGVGQPGTPALPVPYPRTGQGGEPNLTLPDAITGKPGDQGCGPPGVPLPGPTGCYPYREPLPAPPPGGPPPGPPALRAAVRTRIELPPPTVGPPGPCACGRGGNDVCRRTARIAIATALVAILAVAITVVATPWWDRVSRNTFVAYFANTNGLYTGDEVRILGVAVGTVDKIEPQPNAAKVTFSVDSGVPGARRCPGGDPVAVAGQRTRDPAGPGVLRRPETG